MESLVKTISVIAVCVFVALFAVVLALLRLFPREQHPLGEMAAKYAKGKFMKVDGKKVHYVDQGRGTALVLIQGFYYHVIEWEKNMAALAWEFL